MSNLKDELNEYLSRNETVSNGISLGKSTFGKFFRKLETEDNEDLLGNQKKYSKFCIQCPSLSRFQRMMLFCLCICMSTFFFGLSLLHIPMLILKARKFAIYFTLGSCFFLSGFSFLWGPVNYVKHLCSYDRLPFTGVYFFSLTATLYFSIYVKSTLATSVFVVVQILSLVWFLVTYIPGGQTGLSFFRKIFTSTVTSSVSNSLPV